MLIFSKTLTFHSIFSSSDFIFFNMETIEASQEAEVKIIIFLQSGKAAAARKEASNGMMPLSSFLNEYSEIS